MQRFLMAFSAALLVVACGGKVAQEGQDAPAPGGPDAPGDGRETSSAGDSGAATNGDRLFEPTDLPPCEEGFVRSEEPGRACAWLTPDGRCYDTQLAACACLCRETGGDTCSSSFPQGPNSAIPVDCF